ncbi:uncharacterized protein LOC110024453 [Phalaenopsis equestris]|uniref:uncharacterized protein LOC110024453 n=1 Tax=Phalaenopsis equestris TaxID=78828 RepID=UPI0009E1DC3A|nr:uncharacterized protein LOC110024453 [Phalaenopsis equestris]
MDGKKKKGKKKKGNHSNVSGSIFSADFNQTKSDVSLSNADFLPDDHRDAAPVLNHYSEAPCNADSPIVGVSESEVDQEKRKNLEAKCFDLQEEINILRVEKNIWSQKEGSFEERIKLLQNELNSCIQKEARLEEKMDDLQSKSAVLTGRLEERIKLLQHEMDSCIQKESSIKEVVSRLGDANEGLQLQVKELEDSRDSLAQENKQLTDNMSTLESRIQHLEVAASLYASSEIHVEEKWTPKSVEASMKPDILNDEGSEKASYLVGTADNLPSENTMKHSSTDHASVFPKSTLKFNETIKTKTKPNENLNVNGAEDLGSVAQLRQLQGLGLDDSRISADVVSVPLDDIIVELKPAAEKIETEPVVPLSDAPLIGAPFRLISFVARFVSGSDLVDKEKPKENR